MGSCFVRVGVEITSIRISISARYSWRGRGIGTADFQDPGGGMGSWGFPGGMRIPNPLNRVYRLTLGGGDLPLDVHLERTSVLTSISRDSLGGSNQVRVLQHFLHTFLCPNP